MLCDSDKGLELSIELYLNETLAGPVLISSFPKTSKRSHFALSDVKEISQMHCHKLPWQSRKDRS